jgi:hypothetical protein
MTKSTLNVEIGQTDASAMGHLFHNISCLENISAFHSQRREPKRNVNDALTGSWCISKSRCMQLCFTESPIRYHWLKKDHIKGVKLYLMITFASQSVWVIFLQSDDNYIAYPHSTRLTFLLLLQLISCVQGRYYGINIYVLAHSQSNSSTKVGP